MPNQMRSVVLLKVIVLAEFPAILACTLFSLPSLYIGNQQKQYEYCKKVVTVNNIHDTTNEFLQERCSAFDLDELIQIAWEPYDGKEYMSEHTFSCLMLIYGLIIKENNTSKYCFFFIIYFHILEQKLLD